MVPVVKASDVLSRSVKTLITMQMAEVFSERCSLPLHRSTFCRTIAGEGFGEKSLRALCPVALLLSDLVPDTVH